MQFSEKTKRTLNAAAAGIAQEAVARTCSRVTVGSFPTGNRREPSCGCRRIGRRDCARGDPSPATR